MAWDKGYLIQTGLLTMGELQCVFFPFVIFVGLVPPHYRLLGGFFYPSEKWSDFVSWDDELPNIYGKS
jgi:hypothetical protein